MTTRKEQKGKNRKSQLIKNVSAWFTLMIESKRRSYWRV